MGRRKRGGMLDFVNLLILNSIFNSPSPQKGRRRNNPTQPVNSEDSILVQALGFIFVVMAFVGGIKAAFITLISLIVICVFFLIVKSFSKNAIGEQDTQTFTPTDELAALLQRQKLRDKLKYLGCSDGQELLEKYPMCLTDVEKQDIVNLIQNCRNLEQQASGQQVIYEYDVDENRPVINWSKQKPVEYDDDDTYDNFYMQREDEYRQEYGDDFEDAIQDEWEEHQRDKNRR